MSAVGQGHEREEGPVIVDGWVSAIFDAKPTLDLRPSVSRSVLRKVACARGNGPCVMKADNANDRFEAAGALRNSHWEVLALQKDTDGDGASTETV